MDAVEEQSVHQPVEQTVEQPVGEPLPDRTNYTELSDEMMAAVVEEVQGDICPVAKPKRTRRHKAKVEAEEPAPVEPPVEPEPVNETAPSAQALDESDVVVTGAAKQEQVTCNACGKVLTVLSLKYSHQKTCSD